MRKYLIITLIFIDFSYSNVMAQVRADKLYTISGVGTSVPMGETADYLSPKISTTLGVNYGIGNSGFFIYPKFSLHAFSYNGVKQSNGFQYTSQNARASTYLLNVALGYRKTINKYAFYGFVGAGGGFILTPLVKVNTLAQQVNFSNQTNRMTMIEGGTGIEYNLGGLSLYSELSYMIGFNKINDKGFKTLPVTIGLKPNLSRLFNK